MWHFDLASDPLRAGHALPDSRRFLAALNEHQDFFVQDQPLSVGRAPGRLDLMGGVADYSGSLVLELPLAVATWVAVQPSSEPELTLLSTSIASASGNPLGHLPLSSLQIDHRALEYSEAHTLLTATAGNAWAAYVAGVLVLLQHERG